MNSEARIYNRANVLVSQYYIAGVPHEIATAEVLSHRCNFLVDSGAFSNSNIERGLIKGKPVTLDQYINSCKRYYHNKAWGYITLDVISSHEKTEANYQKMLDEGLTPIPVLSPTSKSDDIFQLAETNSRVCVSGLTQQTRVNKTIGRIQKAFKETDGKILTHALGLSRYPMCVQIPVATLDSSSMTIGNRFGSLPFFDPKEGFSVGHWSKALEDPKKVAIIKDTGISIDDVKNPEMYRGLGLCTFIPLYSYIKFANYIEDHYKSMFFFALPGSTWVILLAAMYHSMKGRSHGFDLNIAKEKAAELRKLITQGAMEKYQYALTDCFSETREYITTEEEQREALRNRYLRKKKTK